MPALQSISLDGLIDANIFDLLDLKDIPQAQKTKITDSMLTTVQNRVLARVLDSLSDEEAKTFEQVIDAADDAHVQSFLTEKGIDVAQLTVEEVLRYKTEIIEMIVGQGTVN